MGLGRAIQHRVIFVVDMHGCSGVWSQPGDFIHTMGNAHVYKNHVEPLTMQLERNPRPFPALKLNPDVKDIDGFQMSDFELSGYNPMSKIAMEMAV